MDSRITNCINWLLIGLSSLAALCVMGWWWLYTIPVSEATLHRLTRGMSQAEVQKILGRPTHAVTSGVETMWLYSRNLSVAHLLIRFDGDGHYADYVID